MILKLVILVMIIVSAVGFGFVAGYEYEKLEIVKECNEFWINDTVEIYSPSSFLKNFTTFSS